MLGSRDHSCVVLDIPNLPAILPTPPGTQSAPLHSFSYRKVSPLKFCLSSVPHFLEFSVQKNSSFFSDCNHRGLILRSL